MGPTVVHLDPIDPVSRLEAGQKPCGALDPGQEFAIRTPDSSFEHLSGEDFDRNRVHFQKVNLMTGPIEVISAQPGDAVGIRIDRIDLVGPTCVPKIARWLGSTLGFTTSELYTHEIVDNSIAINDAVSIDIRPMVGCVGTTPATGTLPSLSPAGPTGGNLDIPWIEPGATIWLPVEVPGAMFAMGDLHASMGGGEPMLVGHEVPGVVHGSVLLRANIGIAAPRIESEHLVSFVGTDPVDIDAARRLAIRSAWRWLTVEALVDDNSAFSLCAALLDVTFGGPAGSNVVASFDLHRLRDCGVPTPLLLDVS